MIQKKIAYNLEVPLNFFPDFNFDSLEQARKVISFIRRNLPKDFIKSRSELLCKEIVRNQDFARAEKIACFFGVKGEPDTSYILRYYKEKFICLPKVVGGEIVFLKFEGKLKKGAFEIPEPCSNYIVPPQEIDLFLVPGVIFDLRGFRVGYGKGFYDKVLVRSSEKSKKIALCWSFQVFREIKEEKPQDIFVDEIWTESFVVYPSLASSSKNSVFVRVLDIFS
ncbi:MAG: 5-formyltetrahydrofolate cyclo-ligase [Candidatus Calescibacterium sp.]|jgi:5-formyltetrahydrofolate cyclo-ligase